MDLVLDLCIRRKTQYMMYGTFNRRRFFAGRLPGPKIYKIGDGLIRQTPVSNLCRFGTNLQNRQLQKTIASYTIWDGTGKSQKPVLLACRFSKPIKFMNRTGFNRVRTSNNVRSDEIIFGQTLKSKLISR